jgi:2-polyprenyl-3-methyl-5-hydroxy-6-metoxy-1,4-benzoquinol methylase
MNRDIDSYAQNYLDDYGFEQVMVRYRRELVLQRLMIHKPGTVIEVGCGIESLVVPLAERGGTWDHWHIVEPAAAFVEACSAGIARAGLENVTVHHAFFEETQLRNIAPDMIVCAGLLNEVPSSLEMLRRIAETMRDGTMLHVNVPNATSLHRRLAKSMGLMASLDELSGRAVLLDQRRVFDLGSLLAEIERSGMRVTSKGGYLVKPFTHAQMEAIGPVLTQDVLDGLYELGKEHPDWASEIWAEAVLA